jgi:hypothetical protein
MRRVAALIVLGVLAVSGAPAAFAQSAEDDEETTAERSEQPGGYAYYEDGSVYSSQYDLFVERFGSYGSTPYYDNRTFWERLQSEPGSSTVGVSGL